MGDIQKWWHSSVVYQIYPKSFNDSNSDGIGDIQGIISKLPYLKYLGIDVIWLTPIYQSPEIDGGYDISDYYSINPKYGTMTDFEELIQKSSELGIKIIMDLVLNHTSDLHRWFQEASKSRDNPYHDYYIWSDEATNLQSNFTGSAWEYVPHLEQFYLHFYSKEQPDLNWENPNLRNEIYKMINFWISKGVAGFRLDVIDLIGKKPFEGIKENGPQLHNYLQEMYTHCFKGKNLMTVGETWGATIENAPLYSRPDRNELSMIFQFEQINLDKIPGGQRWDLKELDLQDLKQVFSKWQLGLENNGWNSLFWNNHDLPRIVSRWGNDNGYYRTLSAKMLAILLHGMKGTPYIYQGEEIGMTNPNFPSLEYYSDIETKKIIEERLAKGDDPKKLLRAIQLKARDSGRTPMQWDDTKFAGFSDTEPWTQLSPNFESITVKQALKDNDSIFYTYQFLVNLRKTNGTLRLGKFELLEFDHPHVFAYRRTSNNETLYIICNFHQVETDFSLDTSNLKVLYSNYQDIQLSNKIGLRPYEAIILTDKKE